MIQESGTDYRQHKRDKRVLTAIQDAIIMAERMIDVTALSAIENPQSAFETRWRAFEAKLKTKPVLKNQVYYAEAYNQALDTIQNEIERLELTVSFPNYVITETRPSHFRKKVWFEKGKLWYVYYWRWLASFSQPRTLTIADIAISLILQNGIAILDVLKAVLKQIQSSKFKIYMIFDLPFIETIIESEKFSTNVYVNQTYQTIQQIFLSPISAMLIKQYLQQNNIGAENLSIESLLGDLEPVFTTSNL